MLTVLNGGNLLDGVFILLGIVRAVVAVLVEIIVFPLMILAGLLGILISLIVCVTSYGMKNVVNNLDSGKPSKDGNRHY